MWAAQTGVRPMPQTAGCEDYAEMRHNGQGATEGRPSGRGTGALIIRLQHSPRDMGARLKEKSAANEHLMRLLKFEVMNLLRMSGPL